MAQKARRDNVTKKPRGNSDGYGLQRLERERPDLLERVRSGELSTHAAMVEAGFRKRSLTISLDPRRAAASLCKAFPPEELRTIKRVLDLALLPEPDDPSEPPPPTRSTYYVVVDGDDVSKHRRVSLAFRRLDQLLQECSAQGEPPPAQSWVRDDRGRCFY